MEGGKAKDVLFLTATFLSRNWLLPHFLYYNYKMAGNSNCQLMGQLGSTICLSDDPK